MYSIGTRNKDLKLNNTTGGFEQYHKTITQMRN